MAHDIRLDDDVTWGIAILGLGLDYLGTYTNHIFPARWGLPFSAAAAFVRALTLRLIE